MERIVFGLQRKGKGGRKTQQLLGNGKQGMDYEGSKGLSRGEKKRMWGIVWVQRVVGKMGLPNKSNNQGNE